MVLLNIFTSFSVLKWLIGASVVSLAVLTIAEKFPKNKVFRYSIVAILTLINFVATEQKEDLKEIQDKKAEILKDFKDSINLAQHDSLNANKTDSSNKAVVSAFASKLAEYGLHATRKIIDCKRS